MVSIPSSHEGISIDAALEMCHNLCELSYQFYSENNFNNLHKVLKQLMRLYFDCKDARTIIGDRLLEKSFEIFSVKLMKQLNNSGVFTNDDIWFTTFYLYNILWNYSEANCKFSSGLISAGVETLLFSNIAHTGYIDNLKKNNVYYLLKSSLSIIHNILRTPGHRGLFNQKKIIESLVALTERDDVLSILSTICLGFIASNENVESSESFDILSNFKTILLYLKISCESGGKYKGFTMLELIEVFRANSMCKLQRNAILDLQGVDIFIKCITMTKEEKVKIDILWILRNICNTSNVDKIRSCVKTYSSNETQLVEKVAKCVSWKLDLLDYSGETIKSNNSVFINFAESDFDMAAMIYEQLSDCKKVELESYENDCEQLKNAYDEANIIVVCVSEAFKNSGNFYTGAEYCIRQKKLIFPVLVDKCYDMDGWLKEHMTLSSDICYNLYSKGDDEWTAFKIDIKAQMSVEDNPTSDNENSVMEVNTIVISDDEQSDLVSIWLKGHNLSHLDSKLSSFTMEMMFTLKKMRADAPTFFFEALGKYMGLTFVEILQFDSALSSL